MGRERACSGCCSACFVGCQGGDGQGVYGALHHFVQGSVNESVACERGEAVELLRYDAHRKVTAACAGAHVTHMQMRVVAHFDFAGRQGFQKPDADQGRAISGQSGSLAFYRLQ